MATIIAKTNFGRHNTIYHRYWKWIFTFVSIHYFVICQPNSRHDPFDWVIFRKPGAIRSFTEGFSYIYIGTESADFILQNDSTLQGALESTFEDSTHPTLPLRAINIDAFSKTRFFQKLVDGAGDGISILECDKMVYAEISKFRGSGHAVLGGAKYAELSSFWAVTALFASDSRFSSKEQEWVADRFGERLAAGAVRFMQENGKNSTQRAMANFARFCPLIHDARQLIKDTVQEDIRAAHEITDISTTLADKVLNTCLQMLSA